MLDQEHYSELAPDATRTTFWPADTFEQSLARNEACFQRTREAIKSSRRKIKRSDALIRLMRNSLTGRE
jgi:hypothetical protein